MSTVAVVYVVAFLVTVSLILILRPLAAGFGLVDHPGGRKRHTGGVPVIGGIAIFGGISCGVVLSAGVSSTLALIVAISALLVVVGLVDDMRGLSALEKFAAQIAATALMIGVAGVKISSLGFLTDSGVWLSGWSSIAFTIFAAVGVINAINMIDGMDGLAAGVTGIALAFFGMAALMAERVTSAHLALLSVFSVLGFLVFNVRTGKRPARVFMGDAGSLGLGFVLAWLAVRLSQGAHQAITPIAAVWILAVPLLDAVTVMLRRVIDGRSPFSADRYHLHHILQDHGLTVNQALVTIVTVGIFFGAVGLGSVYLRISENVMLVMFLLFFVSYFFITFLVKRRQTRDQLALLVMKMAQERRRRVTKPAQAGEEESEFASD